MENLILTELKERDNIDKMRVLLYCAKKYSHVINYCDIFGADHAIDFLDIFTGMTIRVPDKKMMTEMVRAIIIFNHMNRINNENTVGLLAKRFNIDPKRVRKIYKITYRKFMQHDLAEPDPNIEKFRSIKPTDGAVVCAAPTGEIYVPDKDSLVRVLASIKNLSLKVQDVLYPADPMAKLKYMISKVLVNMRYNADA
jgi:hypothetical protein